MALFLIYNIEQNLNMKNFYQQDLHKCLILSLIKLRVIFQTEAAELIEADASEIAFDFDYD